MQQLLANVFLGKEGGIDLFNRPLVMFRSYGRFLITVRATVLPSLRLLREKQNPCLPTTDIGHRCRPLEGRSERRHAHTFVRRQR